MSTPNFLGDLLALTPKEIRDHQESASTAPEAKVDLKKSNQAARELWEIMESSPLPD
jgi:hypothetical protein